MLFLSRIYDIIRNTFRFLRLLFPLKGKASAYGKKKTIWPKSNACRFAKKPDWVSKEIIRMKALMPHSGCRTLADCFNRRFVHKGVSIGKTYVSETIRQSQY